MGTATLMSSISFWRARRQARRRCLLAAVSSVSPAWVALASVASPSDLHAVKAQPGNPNPEQTVEPVCPNWSILPIPLREIDSTGCPQGVSIPCSTPPGSRIGTMTACASISGSQLIARADVDTTSGGVNSGGLRGCGADTGTVSMTAVRGIRLRYTPSAPGSVELSGRRAHLTVIADQAGKIELDRSCNGCIDGCAAAAITAGATLEGGGFFPEIATALQTHRPQSLHMTGEFCRGAETVTIGVTFGWPANNVSGAWTVTSGGNKATKLAGHRFTIMMLPVCLPALDSPFPVSWDLVLGGDVSARAALDSVRRANGVATVTLRKIDLSLAGCESCAPTAPPSGDPNVAVGF